MKKKDVKNAMKAINLSGFLLDLRKITWDYYDCPNCSKYLPSLAIMLLNLSIIQTGFLGGGADFIPLAESKMEV